MNARDGNEPEKLLGDLPWVGRSFEGDAADAPFRLDLDANLHLGPAGPTQPGEASALRVIYSFLRQTGRVEHAVGALLGDRRRLLAAFAAFDRARGGGEGDSFRIRLFGTYDGAPLIPIEDDDLPAGPCGLSVNEVKSRLLLRCRSCDAQFNERELSNEERSIESRFLPGRG